MPGSVSTVVEGRNNEGDWLLITYQGQRGWVAGWYCTVDGDINQLPIVSP